MPTYKHLYVDGKAVSKVNGSSLKNIVINDVVYEPEQTGPTKGKYKHVITFQSYINNGYQNPTTDAVFTKYDNNPDKYVNISQICKPMLNSEIPATDTPLDQLDPDYLYLDEAANNYAEYSHLTFNTLFLYYHGDYFSSSMPKFDWYSPSAYLVWETNNSDAKYRLGYNYTTSRKVNIQNTVGGVNRIAGGYNGPTVRVFNDIVSES